jgi:hypothetical protein
VYESGSSMAGVASLAASCERIQRASCAMSGSAALACAGRKKWEDDPDTPESWSQISDTAETWTPIADTAETWTEKTHPAYLQAA